MQRKKIAFPDPMLRFPFLMRSNQSVEKKSLWLWMGIAKEGEGGGVRERTRRRGEESEKKKENGRKR